MDRVASTSTLLALLSPVSIGNGCLGKLLVAKPRTVQLQYGERHILLVSECWPNISADEQLTAR